MKKFSRIRSVDEIKAQCEAQGLVCDDFDYMMGSDRITVSGGGASVSYNTCNGHFSGTTPDGTKFDSSEHGFDEHDWFKALLNFFYAD
ncbi:MAG: hypothetical protein ACOYBW_08795 [Fluviibacter phosphoraccumulans]